MLAAKYRLTGEEDFERVETEGKLVQSASFGLAYLWRGDNETSCFGVIVSKKVSGDAVMRNYIRRTFFEAVRQNWADIKKGFDVVFLVKTTSSKTPTEELMREIKEALRRTGLMN